MVRLARLWRNYSLSIVLGGLFLASWIAQAAVQWVEVHQDAATHGEPFRLAVYWTEFGRATFENWQSEFLQLLTFVVLTSFLRHKGSHESKPVEGEEPAE